MTHYFSQSMTVTGSVASTASPWVIVGDDRGVAVRVTKPRVTCTYQVEYSFVDPNRTNGTVTAHTYASVSITDTVLTTGFRVPPPIAAFRVSFSVPGTAAETNTLTVEGLAGSF